MKLVYKFKNLIKVSKFNLKNKYVDVKDFHNIKLNDAVMILCENNNKILVLKEFRIGLNKISFGLPGGFIEKNEDPKKTAKRELFEETGIHSKNIKFFKKFVRNGNYNCGIDYIFYTKIKKDIVNLEKNVKKKWLSKKQILYFLKKNKFETPGVIAAIFYYIFKLD